MSNLFLIVLSGLAVIGLLCILSEISAILTKNYLPESVTIMVYSEDDMSYQKYKSLIYNIHKNKIIMVGEGKTNIYPDAVIVEKNQLSQYLENNLFTKIHN